MFSCDIQYIGWTIYLNIFGEKDQKRPRKVMAHLYSIDIVICVGHLTELVTNLSWHWWWTVIFVFNRMLQLVRTQITFGSIVLFLRCILSKFVRFLLEAIFVFWTLSPTIKSAIFKPEVILAYRQNNVLYIAWQTYTGTYRYIDSPLGPTAFPSGVSEHSRSTVPAVAEDGLVLTGVWFLTPGVKGPGLAPRGGVPISTILSSGSLKTVTKLKKGSKRSVQHCTCFYFYKFIFYQKILHLGEVNKSLIF